MSVEEAIVEKLRHLSPDKRQELLDFADFLATRSASGRPRRSLYGLWSDLQVSVSEEDIAEARREMWGAFPRNDL